jgi:hypothetical protein
VKRSLVLPKPEAAQPSPDVRARPQLNEPGEITVRPKLSVQDIGHDAVEERMSASTLRSSKAAGPLP